MGMHIRKSRHYDIPVRVDHALCGELRRILSRSCVSDLSILYLYRRIPHHFIPVIIRNQCRMAYFYHGFSLHINIYVAPASASTAPPIAFSFLTATL